VTPGATWRRRATVRVPERAKSMPVVRQQTDSGNTTRSYGTNDRDPNIGRQITLIAPIDLRLSARQHLGATQSARFHPARQLCSDPPPRLCGNIFTRW
jgi:hypothetical protein